MNPLQEHANLFATGKFQVMWPDGTSIWIDGNILMEFEDWENEYPPSCEPKLIARPIADMTDEEIIQLPHLDSSASKETINWYRNSLKDRRGVGIAHKDFLYLLSIGVYPFNQEHFNDGTVIDSKDLCTQSE